MKTTILLSTCLWTLAACMDAFDDTYRGAIDQETLLLQILFLVVFFIVPGLHAIHVIVGVLFLAISWVRSKESKHH